MFRVGQKVVCVYDKGQTLPPYVVKDSVYTIDSIRNLGRLAGLGLEFAELGPCPGTGYFPAKYFRPVVERKPDISVFTEILNRAGKVKEIV